MRPGGGAFTAGAARWKFANLLDMDKHFPEIKVVKLEPTL